MRPGWLLFAFSLQAAEPRPAVLMLPVEYDLTGFLADAERALPVKLASNWEPLGQRIPMPVAYRYDLERTPLEMEGGGVGKAIIRTRIRYAVDVGVPAPNLATGVAWKRISGCRPGRPVVMRLETVIDFAPDWSVTSRTTPRLEMPEACRLTAAKTPVAVDISQKVRLAFADGLNKAAEELDRRIRANAALRPVAEQAWKRLTAPMALGEGATLHLNPTAVSVLRPLLFGAVIRTGVRVEGVPRLGGEAPEARPLPALAWAAEGGDFRLEWESVLAWPEAEEQLRRSLVGKTVKVAGRRTVRIEGLTLAPAGERVMVTAEVSGGIKGRIGLTGRPVFVGEAGRLEIADLRFTLETDNFLIRMADWFRHESTRKKLEQMARVDVLAAVNQQRGRLESALREHFGDSMALRGAFETVGPFGLEFDAERIRLRATLRGSLTLAVMARRP